MRKYIYFRKGGGTVAKKIFWIVFYVIILAFSFLFYISAKDLEVCYHCGGTGAYHCSSCGNTGFVTCTGCKGAGRAVCPGEDGKGKCDSGFYVCPSCHGDTLTRNGDGEIPPDAVPGSCGACSGKGKLECIRCRGTGRENCDRCGGSGKEVCRNGNCQKAESIGWKCPDCSGSGYILTGNPMPPASDNDGVRNVPTEGDKIWKDGKSVTYTKSGAGEGSSGGQDEENKTQIFTSTGANIPRDPATGRDLIWYVDTGNGEWEINGRKVTLTRNGSRASGVLDLKYYENVALVGLPEDPGLTVYLSGADGNKFPLILTGSGEFAVGRHIPEEAAVPFRVSLVIEAPSIETQAPEETETDAETEPADVPETDEGPAPARGNTEITPPDSSGASVLIDSSRLSGEERERYDGLSDEEYGELVEKLRDGIGSARPGLADGDSKDALDAIAKSVGFKDSRDGGMFPVDFKKDLEIGFPARITLPLEKEALDGGSDLYVYRLTKDGEYVPLGKADYRTYPDGSVEEISFYTDAISDLFICRYALADDLSEVGGKPGETNGNDTGLPLVIGVSAVALTLAAAGVAVIKKKRSKQEDK